MSQYYKVQTKEEKKNSQEQQKKSELINYLTNALTLSEWEQQKTKISWTPATAKNSNVYEIKGTLHRGRRHYKHDMKGCVSEEVMARFVSTGVQRSKIHVSNPYSGGLESDGLETLVEAVRENDSLQDLFSGFDFFFWWHLEVKLQNDKEGKCNRRLSFEHKPLKLLFSDNDLEKVHGLAAAIQTPRKIKVISIARGSHEQAGYM